MDILLQTKRSTVANVLNAVERYKKNCELNE